MKLIIAGSRDIILLDHVKTAIEYSGFQNITEVVSGTARGVDTLGEEWAYINKIPVKMFPADWQQFGNRAGPIRNREMARYGDALVAVWDGISSGTKNMIQEMKRQNKPHYVYNVQKITKPLYFIDWSE